MRQVSSKRQAENKLRREVIKQKYGEGDVSCEVAINRRCEGKAVDVHEPHTRARGGSITDPDNMLAICRSCHNWIHSNPVLASSLGLLSKTGDDVKFENRYLRPNKMIANGC